jgi:hypothetical protein
MPIPTKNGGFAMYVEASSQANRPPAASGTGSDRHWSSPSNTFAYSFSNIAGVSAFSTASLTSWGDGQMSRR